jgi:act minimal PKS chain-length factor (CLF/KS beta)
MCEGDTPVPDAAVITGCGVVAPNAIGNEAFAAALAEGRSGIGDLVSFDASESGRERAAEIQNFDPAPYLRSPKNYLDRNSALAFAACEMAVRSGGLKLPDPAKGYGMSSGTMAGNLESLAAFYATIREKGARYAPPFLFPHTYYNTTLGLLSIEYGLVGPHQQFCSGSAAGLEAVAYAAYAVEQGRAPMMLAGGAEAFSEWLFQVALTRGWLSPVGEGRESCQPFSLRRNGAILGEGAAFFCIEPSEAACARQARVLGRIAGYAISSTPAHAMSESLRRAGVATVDAVFAAAGGYAQEDREEAAAIRQVFGKSDVPVVAIKSLIGETFGAGGPLNLAAAVLAAQGGLIPPTIVADGVLENLNLPRQSLQTRPRALLVNAGSPGAGRFVSIVLSCEESKGS